LRFDTPEAPHCGTVGLARVPFTPFATAFAFFGAPAFLPFFPPRALNVIPGEQVKSDASQVCSQRLGRAGSFFSRWGDRSLPPPFGAIPYEIFRLRLRFRENSSQIPGSVSLSRVLTRTEHTSPCQRAGRFAFFLARGSICHTALFLSVFSKNICVQLFEFWPCRKFVLTGALTA